MKKTHLVALFSLLISGLFSQTGAPQLINYQGIARDVFGTIITTPIGIQFEIQQGGTTIYTEAQTAIPSAAGIFTVAIGSGFPAIFSTIPWGIGSKELKVSIDPTGGTSYSVVGISSLLSVPYALYAEKTKPPLVTFSGTTLTVGGTSVNLPGSIAYTAGPGISLTGNIITNTATVTNGNSNITVTGVSPNYVISSTPTLILNGTSLSITNGNTVTLPPAGATYTPGSGISLTGNIITNTAIVTNGNSNITVTGSPSNYTISSTPTLVVSGGSLSISNGNTVTLPTGTTYTAGNGISLTGNIVTNTATVTNGNTNITVTGVSPNYIISSTPTLVVSGGSLSISNGNTVTLPTGTTYTAGNGISLTGNIVTNTATITGGNTNITVTGASPNYTISNTPTLSINAGTLSISNGNSVPLPVAPPPATITGGGITTVTNVGQSFTVATQSPTFTPMGTTSVNGTYPSYTVNTPAQILISTNFTLTSTHGGSAMLPSYAAGNGLISAGAYPNFLLSVSSTGTNAAWSNLGNALTTAPLNFLGTTDAMDLVFKTASTERMRILGIGVNAGFVGIGTPIPFAKLHVSDLNSKIIVDATGGGINTAALDLKTATGGTGSISKLNSTGRLVFSSGGAFNMLFTTAVGGSYQFDEGASTRLFIQAGGNVGIGTTVPGTKLEVIGTAKISDAATTTGYVATIQNNIAGGISGGALTVVNTGARSIGNDAMFIDNQATKAGGSGSTKTGLTIQSTGSWAPGTLQPNIGLFVNVAGADINNSAIFMGGNVGIGTTTPAVPLHINNTSGQVGLQVDGNDPAFSSIYVNSSAGGASPGYGYLQGGILKGGHWINSSGDWHLDVNSGTRQTVLANGNVGIGTNAPSAQLEVNQFTKLGSAAPAVQMIKLTGVTAAPGMQVNIAHGLNSAKILSVSVMVEYVANSFVPSSYTGNPGYDFDYFVTPVNIVVWPKGTSGSIAPGKPIRILITYEQ